MNDDRYIERSDVRFLADLVDLDADDDRLERMVTEIAGGLDGYAELEGVPVARGDRVDREPPAVTINPEADADPHNAFLSRFELGGGGGPLAGSDLAIKDNIAIAGVPMTCGSAVFADAVPETDAAVVDRLLAAGARIVGKTNMDELAYGPTGETSAFGPADNPAAPGHVTGGSSSGSAAAVAAGEADAALGTDTGGSVRIPASFCGLVGVKPTWGAVSQTGVVDLAYSLDHVGVLSRSVETAARVLDVIADETHGAARGASFVDRVRSPPDIADLSFGIPEEFFGEHVADGVETAIRDRIDAMAAAGATVREVAVPLAAQVVSVWNAIVNTEFATFMESGATPLFRREPIDPAWHQAARAGIEDETRQFGPIVQRKAVEGKFLVQKHGTTHYVAARNRGRALAAEFDDALASCDVLVTPTMATQALERGTWSPHSYSAAGADATPPLAINTRPADIAGIPAVTVPARTDEDRPIGLQFMGSADDDAGVLAAAAAFERWPTAD